MKKILVLLLMLSFGEAYSQKYMDKIVKSSCECFEDIDAPKDKEQMTMQLGLCMMEAAMPYNKQLKKDYDVDLQGGNLEQEGEKLGRIIGMKMAGECPNALMKMVEVAKEDEEQAAETGAGTFEGTITDVEEGTFVTFSAKDEKGQKTKFYWLTYVESDLELVNDYKSLKGKDVEIGFDTHELFDPNNKEYRLFKVINSLQVL